MKRKAEAYLAVIFKGLFISDILFFILIRPLEFLFFKRLSDALVLQNNELSMLLTGKFIHELRKLDRGNFLNTNAKLYKMKKSFSEGLQKLDFSNNKCYFTKVNSIFYTLLKEDQTIKKSNLTSEIIESKNLNQTEAKLTLIKAQLFWYFILSNKRKSFFKFLFRKEEILKIKIYR